TIASIAQGDEYNYLRAGRTKETLQDGPRGDVVFTGRTLDLSIALGDSWALTANRYKADSEEPITRVNPDTGQTTEQRDIPQKSSMVGLLFHSPVSAGTELLLSYEKGERKFWFMDSSGPLYRDGKEDGKRVSAGLKAVFFGRLETRLLQQQFKYEDSVMDRENKITDMLLEANYHLSSEYTMGLSFTRNDYSERYVAGVGISF
ncbi:MAG TPA: hypothetical protein VFX02_02445, partial [Gammaproteobacteria bacterium]|nr:hypothetical protein [Gammaproteobacteria bacterium]